MKSNRQNLHQLPRARHTQKAPSLSQLLFQRQVLKQQVILHANQHLEVEILGEGTLRKYFREVEMYGLRKEYVFRVGDRRRSFGKSNTSKSKHKRQHLIFKENDYESTNADLSDRRKYSSNKINPSTCLQTLNARNRQKILANCNPPPSQFNQKKDEYRNRGYLHDKDSFQQIQICNPHPVPQSQQKYQYQHHSEFDQIPSKLNADIIQSEENVDWLAPKFSFCQFMKEALIEPEDQNLNAKDRKQLDKDPIHQTNEDKSEIKLPRTDGKEIILEGMDSLSSIISQQRQNTITQPIIKVQELVLKQKDINSYPIRQSLKNFKKEEALFKKSQNNENLMKILQPNESLAIKKEQPIKLQARLPKLQAPSQKQQTRSETTHTQIKLQLNRQECDLPDCCQITETTPQSGKPSQVTIKYNIKFLENRSKETEVIRVSPLRFRKKEQVVDQLVKRHIVPHQSNSIVFP